MYDQHWILAPIIQKLSGIETVVYDQFSTFTRYFEVRRDGVMIWRLGVVQSELEVMEKVQYFEFLHFDAAVKIYNQFLDEYDWSTYFDPPTPPKNRIIEKILYAGFMTKEETLKNVYGIETPPT